MAANHGPYHYRHGWIPIDGAPAHGHRSADKIAAQAHGSSSSDLAKLKAQADKLGPHSKAAHAYAAALAAHQASAPKGGKKKVSLADVAKGMGGGKKNQPPQRSADKIADKALGKDATAVKPVTKKPVVVSAEHKKTSLDGMSQAQLGALKLYTGDDYRGINGGLRDGKVPAKYQKTVTEIDSALESKPLSEPTKVWRTVGGNAFGLSKGSDVSSLKGKVFTEAGFMSTSVKNQRFPVNPPPVHLTVEVPAGVGAAYLESITKNKTENELLLPRNLRYAITNVRRSAQGGWTATARVLPPSES